MEYPREGETVGMAVCRESPHMPTESHMQGSKYSIADDCAQVVQGQVNARRLSKELTQDSEPDPEPANWRRKSQTPQTKTLGVVGVVALIFFNVCGGPYGVEDTLKAGGVQLTIWLFLIMPLVWSLPEAFVMAELSSAFPNNSGYVTWVGVAFGPFLGYMEGALSWSSSVIDNAIYPALFMRSLDLAIKDYIPGFSDHVRWLTAVFSLILIFLNYRGLEIVANMTIFFAVVTMLPFILITFLAIPNVEPSNWSQPIEEDIDWDRLMNTLFWCLNYWDTVATVSGEVKNPQKTFPRAVTVSLAIVMLSYFVPLLICTGVSPPDGENWDFGYFAKVGQMVGDKLGSKELGIFLLISVIISSLVSSIGQFQSELCAASYQVQGMATEGWIPSRFGHTSAHNTPTVGIVLSAIIILIGSQFKVTEIIDALNLPYCFAALLEFAAFLKLRWSHDDLPRPYRVPLPFWGCVLFLLPTTFFVACLVVMDFYHGKVMALSFLAVILGLSVLSYFVFHAMRVMEWVKFDCDPMDHNYSSSPGSGGSLIDKCGNGTDVERGHSNVKVGENYGANVQGTEMNGGEAANTSMVDPTICHSRVVS